jgi:RNA polymerase sigma factor (sigma-70 family)
LLLQNRLSHPLSTQLPDPETRFRALFDEHYRPVARYLLSRGYQAADVDDLIAETFLVAWRRLDVVPAGRDAVPWLLTVARNVSRNAWRKSRRELAFLEELTATMATSTELGAEERDDFVRVVGALGELKTLDRDLILLVAWDGLSPSEAGEVLGLRPVAARTRLHRARKRLQTLLPETAPAARWAHEPERLAGLAHQIGHLSASQLENGGHHDA